MSLLHTDQDPRHRIPNPMEAGYYRLIPLAAVVLGFVLVSANYGSLPAEIPTHFNVNGEIDGYGSKVTLWILPVINLGMFYFLRFTSRVNFKYFNYPVPITETNAAQQHTIALELVTQMRLMICLMIAYLIFAIVRSAQTGADMFSGVVFGGLLVGLFVNIGWQTYRAFRAK